MEIKPIRIPRNIIGELPPPVVDRTPAPIVRGLELPVVDVPTPVIDYPVIDAPVRTEFEQDMVAPVPQIKPPQPSQQVKPEPDRAPPQPPPPPSAPPLAPQAPQPSVTIDVPVVGEVDLPPVAPLVTAGATAVVTTTVVLVSNIVLGQVKQALDGPLKRLLQSNKKKKVKLKQKKPVLHYVLNEEQVSVFEYSVKGTRLITTTDKPEQYIRDQVELSSVYEYDNVILINDDMKDLFSKEGQIRFKKLFCPAKTIVKKLSAKISF